jgi:two-component SAPR family response regulator
VQDATILVVDDDPDIRQVLVEALKDEHYRPIAAADGREAIARLSASNGVPDLVLLDLIMPGVNGYGVLEHIRQNLPQDLPVLIFSAQRPDPSVLDALDSELRDFVAKPFELEELLIRMQRLLRRSPQLATVEATTLKVYALGTLEVFRGDTLLFDESWRNRPAKAIFKLLLTYPGRLFQKDVLAEELWPEADPGPAANRLRVAIYDLRKALGESGRKDGLVSHIAQQEGAYYFDPGAPCWIDTQAFDDAAERGHALAAEGQLNEALAAYGAAEGLYRGEYLRDDLYVEWPTATRERLRETYLAMLADAAHIHALAGGFDEAAAFCRKILRVEPWREEVYRRLMEYLAAAGRPNDALRAYEECRRALRAEVDAEPSPETKRLRDEIAGRR